MMSRAAVAVRVRHATAGRAPGCQVRVVPIAEAIRESQSSHASLRVFAVMELSYRVVVRRELPLRRNSDRRRVSDPPVAAFGNLDLLDLLGNAVALPHR